MYLYVKMNLDANRFLPVENKDYMNSASYEYRNMSTRRGAQFVPMIMSIISLKTILLYLCWCTVHVCEAYIVFPEIIENEYFVNISLIFDDHWH